MATWQHLRSSTANKRPTTSLADGRIAINTNTASPGLFFKDSAGTGIVKVGPVHVGTTAPNSTPAAGGSSGNYTGEQWLDTSVSPAQLKVWNGSAWVGVVADELPVSKLQDGDARQLLQTDAAGTGVEWTSNVDVPGTLDVTSTATFDSIARHPLGSAAAPTLTFTGDTNTGIYSPGADQVAISTNGTQRINIEADGDINIDSGGVFYDATNNRLAVGTTSPGAALEINAAASTSPAIFKINTSEVGRWDTSGRLLVGTSSTITTSIAGLTYTGSKEQLAGIDGNQTTKLIAQFSSATAISPTLAFARSTGSTVGTQTAIATGSTPLGRITAAGSDGTKFIEGARIDVLSDAAFTTDSAPSRLAFYTTPSGSASPVERMRIDSSGRVGVGTTSPDLRITVQEDNPGRCISLLSNDGNAGGRIGTTGEATTSNGLLLNANRGSGSIQFQTNSLERARIDSSGRLLVGTSSARANFNNAYITPQFQVESTTMSLSSAALIANGSAAGNNPYARLFLARSRGALGTNVVVAANDTLGGISYQGNDGTEFVEAASIEAFVDGTPGANDMPGRLAFSTTADGASSPTPRVTIDSNGNTFLSSTAFSNKTGIQATSGFGLKVLSYSTTNTTELECFAVSTATRYAISFSNPNGVVGSISTSASATAYNTSSDYRLKENVTPVTDGIIRLQQLKPSRFNFIADPDKTVDGFIAHEVQTVVPEAITGEKDAVDENGDPQYQGIDQSKLVPLLTAALQEAIGEIESLKARVAALESA